MRASEARPKVRCRNQPGASGANKPSMLCSLALSAAWPTPLSADAARPNIYTQFSATMRIAQTDKGPDGKPGDGCVAARKLDDPAVSRVWFDAAAGRLAQTNAELARKPQKVITVFDRFDLKPPTALELEPFFNETICYTQPIPPGYCPNGTQACPPRFGGFGDLFTPFTSVLGDFYLNT